MKRILLVVVSVLLIFSLVSCSSGPAKEESNSDDSKNGNNKEESKDIAPDFTLMSSDGEEVTLSSLKGKPVHLVVWSVG